MQTQYPIFIISRDRVTCLSALVQWLEAAGHERIYILDNDSTYEPLLEYYEKSPHTIVYLRANTGQNGLWHSSTALKDYATDQYFVVTDPDIVPVEDCPLDAVDYFREALDRFTDRTKVGFGMKLDDLPDHYKFKQDVINYESQYLEWGAPEPGFNFAPIDTTFALYRPGASPDISYSCRTQAPYVARHLPWYIDSDNVPPEEQYYIDNANLRINSWNHISLPFWLGGQR